MSQNRKKKNGGFCGVFTVLFLAAAVVILFPFAKEIIAGFSETGNMPSSEKVKEYLEGYVDPDTRVIFAHYDGIEEDIAAYQDPIADTMTEEERRSWAEYSLQSDYLEKEVQRALQTREKQICVVGRLTSMKGYVNNPTAGLGYDGSVFRTMPYSTFWMKSYEAYSGTLSEGRLGKTTFEDHFYIYTFEYYDLSDEEIQEMKDRIDVAADDILSCIPAGADLWQKCRVIHDELVKRTEYDHAVSDHCGDLYGALVNHTAVCEGYALAFQYVLNRAGERCDVVVSDWDRNPESTAHAWNQIYAPTDEQYIDVTWDDTDYTDGNGEAIITYDYFGLTAEEIAAIDSHAFAAHIPAGIDSPMAFNYYRHEGYLLSSYDVWSTAELLQRQYEEGSSYLTVRFADQQAWQQANAGLFDGGEMDIVLDQLGYYGSYWYSTNEELYTIAVGLGTVSE